MEEDYDYKYLKYKSKYKNLLKTSTCQYHKEPGCGCGSKNNMMGGGKKQCNCNVFIQKGECDCHLNTPPEGCGLIGGASKKKSKKHKALTIYRYVVGDLVRDIYGNMGIVEELWVDRNPIDPHTEKYFIKFNNGTQAWVHSSGLQKVYDTIDTYQQIGPNTYIPKEKKAVYTPDVYNYIAPSGQILTATQTFDPLYANTTNVTSVYTPQYSYPTSYVPVAKYHEPNEVIIKKSSKKSSKKRSKRNYRGGNSLVSYENISSSGAPPLPPRGSSPLPPPRPTTPKPISAQPSSAPPSTTLSNSSSQVVHHYYPYAPVYNPPLYSPPVYYSDPIITLNRRPSTRKSSTRKSSTRKSSKRKSSKRK